MRSLKSFSSTTRGHHSCFVQGWFPPPLCSTSLSSAKEKKVSALLSPTAKVQTWRLQAKVAQANLAALSSGSHRNPTKAKASSPSLLPNSDCDQVSGSPFLHSSLFNFRSSITYPCPCALIKAIPVHSGRLADWITERLELKGQRRVLASSLPEVFWAPYAKLQNY